MFRAVVDFLNKIGNGLVSAANAVGNASVAVFNTTKERAASVFSAAKEGVASAVNTTTAAVSSVFNAIKNGIISAAASVDSFLVGIFNSVKNFFSSFFGRGPGTPPPPPLLPPLVLFHSFFDRSPGTSPPSENSAVQIISVDGQANVNASVVAEQGGANAIARFGMLAAGRPVVVEQPEPAEQLEMENGKFRNECLNLHLFRTLDEAKYEIDLWREHYNNIRPHSSLNYMSPVEYARRVA